MLICPSGAQSLLKLVIDIVNRYCYNLFDPINEINELSFGYYIYNYNAMSRCTYYGTAAPEPILGVQILDSLPDPNPHEDESDADHNGSCDVPPKPGALPSTTR